MLLLRKKAHKYEKLGASLVMIGTIALLLDVWTWRADQQYSVPGKRYFKYKSNMGTELLLLLANIPAGIYLALNRSLMRDRVLTHVAILNISIAVIFTVLAILFENATLDVDPKTGLFGWLNNYQCFVSIFFYGFLSTFFGTIGYILSM